MGRVRLITVVLLSSVLVTASGCKSKQEAPAPNISAPQQNEGGVKSISGQNTAGGVATSPRDKSDAEAAAAHVLAQMEAGDFSAIYNEAAPGFKKIGSESQFVAMFKQTRMKTGLLKNPQEVSFVTRPDQTHVLNFRLENERFTTERRLTFARAKSGKMELFGLNQHDDPKPNTHAK